MDGMPIEHESKNRLSHLCGFWSRARAKHDQEYLEVLSSPDGAKDVHDAKLAAQSAQANISAEAARGFLYMG